MLRALLTLTVFAVCAASARAGNMDLSEVVFSAGVTTPDDNNWQGLHLLAPNIPNPLHLPLSGGLGASQSSADVDLAWASSFAAFLMQSRQQAAGQASGFVRTSASGTIWITSSEDLLLSIDASWTFDLPAWQMGSSLGVGVAAVGSPVPLFSESVYGQPEWPGGLSDTITISGQVVLPAGQTWIIGYGMELQTERETQGLMATGSGYVDLQITPEPATALPLALTLCAMSRRRHRGVRTATRLS